MTTVKSKFWLKGRFGDVQVDAINSLDAASQYWGLRGWKCSVVGTVIEVEVLETQERFRVSGMGLVELVVDVKGGV
jgi:hypothetical protein